jgi:BirA family biotin operon repressor/biotin-[acetyl-CoA-carboxylase] ligase
VGSRSPREALGTKVIGAKLFAYDMVTSTNDLAHFLADQDEPEGTIIFAKGQTEGRGRHGKSWASPRAQGLYFSFILRPEFDASGAPRITLVTAWAIAMALRDADIEDVSVKWPNDIWVKGKKVCGILTEMSLKSTRIRYVIVGAGLNVNTPSAFLPDQATSLKEATGRVFDMEDLSHIIMKRIDQGYALLIDGRFQSVVIQGLKEFSVLALGGRVRVTWEDHVVEGYAVDFDETGALVVRCDNGLMQKVVSGHLEKI